MNSKNERKGEILIFFELIIWACFPVVTVLSYAKLPSIVSLLWVTIFSAVFFILIIAYKNTWAEFKNPLLWKYSALATLFIAILFYGLYFWGLTKTTAGNASIIALFEIFTSFLFFNVLKKEHISVNRKLGAFFIVIGAVIVLAPNFTGINAGDFLVLAATLFAPAGNYFTQKARKIASGASIMFLRSLIAIPFLFVLTQILNMHSNLTDIKSSLLFLFINGFIIFGFSKILWVEGINYISVTKAIALSSTAPILTLFLSWILLHQIPSIFQLTAFIPMILGILLLTDQFKLFKNR